MDDEEQSTSRGIPKSDDDQEMSFEMMYKLWYGYSPPHTGDNYEETDEDIKCKNPNCKNPNKKASTILKHLAKAKKTCNLYYDDNEKAALREKSYHRTCHRKCAKQKRNYDPSKRKEKHNKSYDPSKRKEEHNKSYDPSKRKEEHKKSYDPSKRKEEHKKSYDPDKRQLKHKTSYGEWKQKQMEEKEKRWEEKLAYNRLDLNVTMMERAEGHAREKNRRTMVFSALHFIKALEILKTTLSPQEIKEKMSVIWKKCFKSKDYKGGMENALEEFLVSYKTQNTTDLPEKINEKLKQIIDIVEDVYHNFESEIDQIKIDLEGTCWNTIDNTKLIGKKYDNLYREYPHGNREWEYVNFDYSARLYHEWNDQIIEIHQELTNVAQKIGIDFDFPLTSPESFEIPLNKNTLCDMETDYKYCNLCRKEKARQIREDNGKKIAEGEKPEYPYWWHDYIAYETENNKEIPPV